MFSLLCMHTFFFFRLSSHYLFLFFFLILPLLAFSIYRLLILHFSSPPSAENLYPFRCCDDSSNASQTSHQNQSNNQSIKSLIANSGSRVSHKSKRNDSIEHTKCFDILDDNEKNSFCKNDTVFPISNTLHITIPPLLIDRTEPELPQNGTCCEFDPIYLEMERKKLICDSRNGSLFIPDGKITLKRILIVDDSMLCQKIIIKVLDGANYSFETAGNGKEACDKIGTTVNKLLCV
jgi:CheY-like chemotaxis protein